MRFLKNIINKIGFGFKFIFVNIWYTLLFILDNSIGLIFNKSFTRYSQKLEEDSLWRKIRQGILVIILLILVFSFKYIYDNTFSILIGEFLRLLGKPFQNNIYGEILYDFGHEFAEGIGTTLYLSLIGTTIGFILALVFSLAYTLKDTPYDSKNKRFFKSLARRSVKLYVTVIRGTPMMVQAMILFWGLKNIIGWSYLVAGLTIVSINTTAYLTEVLRGGIESIDKGQTEGALSLGLNGFQTMMFVVFPQAIKNSMASIGNEFVINIKDTSVLSVILVVDLFRKAQIVQNQILDPFPPYIIAALIYLVLTTSTTAILRKVEKSFDLPTKELPSGN